MKTKYSNHGIQWFHIKRNFNTWTHLYSSNMCMWFMFKNFASSEHKRGSLSFDMMSDELKINVKRCTWYFHSNGIKIGDKRDMSCYFGTPCPCLYLSRRKNNRFKKSCECLHTCQNGGYELWQVGKVNRSCHLICNYRFTTYL